MSVKLIILLPTKKRTPVLIVKICFQQQINKYKLQTITLGYTCINGEVILIRVLIANTLKRTTSRKVTFFPN